LHGAPALSLPVVDPHTVFAKDEVARIMKWVHELLPEPGSIIFQGKRENVRQSTQSRMTKEGVEKEKRISRGAEALQRGKHMVQS